MSVPADLEAGATILATLLAVGGTFRSVRASGRSKAQQAAKDRADFGKDRYDEGYKTGYAVRDDEVRQLKSERDDARHDRDVQREDGMAWRRQYLDLRDGKA